EIGQAREVLAIVVEPAAELIRDAAHALEVGGVVEAQVVALRARAQGIAGGREARMKALARQPGELVADLAIGAADHEMAYLDEVAGTTGDHALGHARAGSEQQDGEQDQGVHGDESIESPTGAKRRNLVASIASGMAKSERVTPSRRERGPFSGGSMVRCAKDIWRE